MHTDIFVVNYGREFLPLIWVKGLLIYGFEYQQSTCVGVLSPCIWTNPLTSVKRAALLKMGLVQSWKRLKKL